MKPQQQYLYCSENIRIVPPGFRTVEAELCVTVGSSTIPGSPSEFASTLSIWAGPVNMQIYPTITQLDVLIDALQRARAALAERIATQEIAA